MNQIGSDGLEEVLSIFLAEVAELVKKLRSSKAPGVDEIHGIQQWFAAGCEVAEFSSSWSDSTSKAEAMVLCWKKCTAPFRLELHCCLEQRNLSILGSYSRVMGKCECEIDRWFGVANLLLRPLFQTVVLKRELSR